MDMVKSFIGLWLHEAVRVLRQGGLESDAKDLEGACGGLKDEAAEATGAGRKEGARRKEEQEKEAEDAKFRKEEEKRREEAHLELRGKK